MTTASTKQHWKKNEKESKQFIKQDLDDHGCILNVQRSSWPGITYYSFIQSSHCRIIMVPTHLSVIITCHYILFHYSINPLSHYHGPCIFIDPHDMSLLIIPLFHQSIVTLSGFLYIHHQSSCPVTLSHFSILKFQSLWNIYIYIVIQSHPSFNYSVIPLMQFYVSSMQWHSYKLCKCMWYCVSYYLWVCAYVTWSTGYYVESMSYANLLPYSVYAILICVISH